MMRDACEAMLAQALHPQGVHPLLLSAPQDHPHVLRRLQDTLQATQREGKCLWDITLSALPHTDTPAPTRSISVAGTGSGVCVDGVARGLGVGVLDEGVVVEVDEVVVVVEDVE